MATKAIIFDSNVWIGYFNTEDSTHSKAVAFFKMYNNYTIVLTEYVLLEVATVLKQKIGYAATNKIVTMLLQTENIQLLQSADYFAPTLNMFLTSKDKNLSFVDVSLVVLAYDFVVITFDKKLATALKSR